jgi:hypothetical protein
LNFERSLNKSNKKDLNARHHPPRRTAELKQVSRMKAALFAVGCIPLLCGGVGKEHIFIIAALTHLF